MSPTLPVALSRDRRELIEEAALRAVVYADLFDCPLTAAELARYLPCRAAPVEVEACVREPRYVARDIVAVGPHFCRRGHEHVAEICQERARQSRGMWRRARLVARLLAIAPFVRMVAVTGALAVDNCRAKDDIDLLLVTSPGRVWVSRRLVVLLSRLLRGGRLCPNFVLSDGPLVLAHRNFYVAHELAQMVPLYGEDIYRRMRRGNGWVSEYLPNADDLPRPEPLVRVGRLSRAVKRAAEWIVDRAGVNWLERWELGRMVRRARALGHLGDPTVVLDEHQCKAHFIDYPALLLTRYREALALVGLEAGSLADHGVVHGHGLLGRSNPGEFRRAGQTGRS